MKILGYFTVYFLLVGASLLSPVSAHADSAKYSDNNMEAVLHELNTMKFEEIQKEISAGGGARLAAARRTMINVCCLC